MATDVSYRSLLRDELERRCRMNPRYSLRAFARDLRVSPSRLTHVLRGNFGLSRSAATEIAKRLGWSEAEREHFADLVESEHGRSQALRKLAEARLREAHGVYRTLELDYYAAISDWYHFAILGLTELNAFRADPRRSAPGAIAKALGLETSLIVAALARLKRLELIREVDGVLTSTGAANVNPAGVPSPSVRASHRQVLAKAAEVLDEQPPEERDFSALMLSVRAEDLPEAKAFIRKFRRDFDRKFSLGKESKDRVYCLAVQFFGLLASEGKKK